METHEILSKLKEDKISIEEAELLLRRQPFEEMGFAKLDTHRKIRSGFSEVIFCSGKTDEHLLQIFGKLYEEDGEVLGTRASKDQYDMIKKVYPETEYDEVSHIIKIEKKDKKKIGKIVVCSAGTADISVAEEAAKTAEFFGSNVIRLYDVGVSGIHRLLSKLDIIQSANCVIAVAVCLDNLNITDVVSTELYEGYGFVRCQHGVIPVPVPAVANIAEKHGLSLHITNIEGELVTPTGAAIIAAIKNIDKLPKKFSIEKIGIGAGKRNYERPSLLRAMLIKDKTFENNKIYKLESNIDDCTGEMLGYVMELLFKAGARDVHYIPVYMKKNRPAYQLNVVCLEKDIEILENIIFEETTTIGIRRIPVERSVLKRRIEKIRTSLGEAEVKICMLNGKERVYPEYESIKKICSEYKMNFQEVYQLIQREYKEIKG